jgi:hypothetical protein
VTIVSLGLRRHTAAPSAPEKQLTQHDVPYGFHRGLPRKLTKSVANPSQLDNAATELTVEFIQPMVESDTVIDGMSPDTYSAMGTPRAGKDAA